MMIFAITYDYYKEQLPILENKIAELTQQCELSAKISITTDYPALVAGSITGYKRGETEMNDMEKIYEHGRGWLYFEDSEGGTIGVYCSCTKCSKFLSRKNAKCFTNSNGNIKLTGFVCQKCGEVEPYYDRFE